MSLRLLRRPPLLVYALAAMALAWSCGDDDDGEAFPGGPVCGDGRVDGEEACDEGADRNGGYGSCLADCSGPGPRCGDGNVDSPDEVCDDGHLNGSYGRCEALCGGPGPRCGDGRVTPGEEVCDDGEDNGTYGACAANCAGPGPRCNDGNIDVPDEVCDDGLGNGAYGLCARGCQGPGPSCGDGTVDVPDEACDDGERNGTPGACGEDCQPVPPGCGDGLVQEATEGCDDGRLNGTYGHCAADCSGPGGFCGDGLVQPAEEVCDDGERNGSYGGCADGCAELGPHCGDGNVDAPDEACDDGPDNGEPGACQVDCAGPGLAFGPAPPADQVPDPEAPVCAEDDWLAKYLTYRLRLRGDGTAANPGFVSVGRDAGQSIPASRREPDANCAGHWTRPECPPEDDDPTAQGIYFWGDATIWLGAYLEVLAMEHAVFADLELDTTRTLGDLALALEAFNRVDEAAEVPFGEEPARDGFFLRDDVPLGFHRTADGDYRFPRSDGDLLGYECVSSTSDCGEPSVAEGHFVSQDQMIGLIHGLALVIRLVPEGLQAEGLDVVYEARAIVHRMVNHVRSNGWRIADPNGDHPPDAWGGNAISFSNQLAKAANELCGDRFGVDEYRNFASRVEGEAIWAALQIGWDFTHGYNRTMAFRLAAVTDEWSADKLARLTVGDAKEYFSLTHAVMHGVQTGDALSLWHVESVLSSAPCGGPCRDSSGCVEARGWKGETRVMNPGDRAGSRHHPHAHFNGLDYMALHNAYYLYRRGSYRQAAPEPPDGCEGFPSVQRMLAGAVTDDEVYDPADPCSRGDLRHRFCGRSWGAWLGDAYAGRATLNLAGTVLDCSGAGPCSIETGENLRGTGGDDLIVGTNGPDDMDGRGGDDCLYGLDGDDTLAGSQGQDELHGGAGDDELYGEDSGLVLDGERDLLFGDEGADLLKGGPHDDELYGGPGNDRLIGDSGDDILEAEEGDDYLQGDAGEDTLNGGPGDDELHGDSGDDAIWCGPGRDRAEGDAGDDWIYGEGGDDFLKGDSGADMMVADTGHDRVCGGRGADVIWGGWDGDECRGSASLSDDDQVNGCEDGSASEDDCSNDAFESW